MKCKDCYYWKRNTESYDDSNFGICTSDKFEDCSERRYDNEPDDKFFIWDFEGYHASFETGQNFGCIHFIEK